MTPDLVEKCARVICETRNVEGFECTCPRPYEPEGNNWCNGNRAIAQAIAVIDALADGVTDEMGDAFDKAHVAYWDKHWVSSQDLNFSKTRKAANRIALSAAIRAAKGRTDHA